jgi:hypothetical protein
MMQKVADFLAGILLAQSDRNNFVLPLTAFWHMRMFNPHLTALFKKKTVHTINHDVKGSAAMLQGQAGFQQKL